MVYAFIVGCEIAFWAFVLAGLTMRYVFRRNKAGIVLLFCTPLVDLLLLAATVIDLRNGKEATFAHALAAVYIGVSIGFGHRMIRWADVRFAHRFAGGPPIVKLFGQEHARRERSAWLLHLVSWTIGCAILYGMIEIIGVKSQTEALLNAIRFWTYILAIDFLISFSYTIWPRKPKI